MAPAAKPRKFTDFMLVLSAVRYLREATATDLVKFVMSIYDEPRAVAKRLVKQCVDEGKTGGIFEIKRHRVRISKYLMHSSDYNSLCRRGKQVRARQTQKAAAPSRQRGRPRLIEPPTPTLPPDGVTDEPQDHKACVKAITKARKAASKKATWAEAPKDNICRRVRKKAPGCRQVGCSCAMVPKEEIFTKVRKKARKKAACTKMGCACAKAPKDDIIIKAIKKAPKKAACRKPRKKAVCAKTPKDEMYTKPVKKENKKAICSRTAKPGRAKAPKKAPRAKARVKDAKVKTEGDGETIEEKKSACNLEYIN